MEHRRRDGGMAVIHMPHHLVPMSELIIRLAHKSKHLFTDEGRVGVFSRFLGGCVFVHHPLMKYNSPTGISCKILGPFCFQLGVRIMGYAAEGWRKLGRVEPE